MNDPGTRPDPLTALPDGLRFLLHSGERIYVSEYGVRDDGVTNSIGGRMSATNDVTKGFDSTQSTQVSLGLAMSEHVRIWRDGEPVLMKIKSHTDCDDLEQVLCSGAVSTRRYGRAHYREVASFDSSTSMICVGITSRFSHASESTIGRGLFIQLGPVRRGGLYDGCWEDLEQYIIRAAEGAQARGEVVVVGRGPNPGKGEPAVLISTSNRQRVDIFSDLGFSGAHGRQLGRNVCSQRSRDTRGDTVGDLTNRGGDADHRRAA